MKNVYQMYLASRKKKAVDLCDKLIGCYLSDLISLNRLTALILTLMKTLIDMLFVKVTRQKQDFKSK